MRETQFFNEIFFDIERSFSESETNLLSAINAYECLAKRQNIAGFIEDSFVKELDVLQYGTSFFGLSSVILSQLLQSDGYLFNAKKAFNYCCRKVYTQPTTSDNVLALLLSLIFLKRYRCHSPITRILENTLSKVVYNTTLTSKQGNNNFALRCLCHLLNYLLTDNKAELELALDWMNNHVLQWQLSDGIFVDYPRNINGAKYKIFPLAYHARFTFIMLLFGLISGDEGIKRSGFKALDALIQLIAPDGELCYYGRSLNSIFGYVNGIVSCALGYVLMREQDQNKVQRYLSSYKLLSEYLRKFQSTEGLFYIVPNRLRRKRCGYESYMFDTVYNAYAIALLLISGILERGFPGERHPQNITCNRINLLNESGFVLINQQDLSIGFTRKETFFFEDGVSSGPKYTALVPLFLKFRGIDILPSAPHLNVDLFTSQSYSLHPKWVGFLPYIQTEDGDIIYGEITKTIYREINHSHCFLFTGSTINVHFERAIECVISKIKRRISKSRHKPSMFLDFSSSYTFNRVLIINNEFVGFYDTVTLAEEMKTISAIKLIPFTLRTFNCQIRKVLSNAYSFSNALGSFMVVTNIDTKWKRKRQIMTSKGLGFYWEAKPIKFKSHTSFELLSLLIPQSNTLGKADIENLLRLSESTVKKIMEET